MHFKVARIVRHYCNRWAGFSIACCCVLFLELRFKQENLTSTLQRYQSGVCTLASIFTRRETHGFGCPPSSLVLKIHNWKAEQAHPLSSRPPTMLRRSQLSWCPLVAQHETS